MYIPAELTLQIPHATVHSSLVADAWLAWQSMHKSMMWLRQMAQLSTTMSQAQRATAFHCIVSVRPSDAMVSWLPYLLDFELLFSFRNIAARAGLGVLHLGRRSGICHLDVGHDGCEVCGVLRGGFVVFSSELEGAACCAMLISVVRNGCSDLGEKVISQVVIETINKRCLHVKEARYMDGITSLQRRVVIDWHGHPPGFCRLRGGVSATQAGGD